MSCNWEGNRRSGVALAMRHRLEWFIHLRAQGLSKGDEYPTNTPHGVWYSLPFYMLYLYNDVFGRPFVKRFTLCYRSVVCLSVCPVCL